MWTDIYFCITTTNLEMVDQPCATVVGPVELGENSDEPVLWPTPVWPENNYFNITMTAGIAKKNRGLLIGH